MNIHPRVSKVLFTKEQLQKAAKKIAAKIDKDYKGKKPILIGLLKGCFPFFSDVFFNLKCEATLDFMTVSSYHGTESGKLNIVFNHKINIKNQHIIIVDDIIDTGKTMTKLVEVLKKEKPASIKVVCMLDKHLKNKNRQIQPDYYCFKIPNDYIIGYGFDYNDQYRNLPYVGILKKGK